MIVDSRLYPCNKYGWRDRPCTYHALMSARVVGLAYIAIQLTGWGKLETVAQLYWTTVSSFPRVQLIRWRKSHRDSVFGCRVSLRFKVTVDFRKPHIFPEQLTNIGSVFQRFHRVLGFGTICTHIPFLGDYHTTSTHCPCTAPNSPRTTHHSLATCVPLTWLWATPFKVTEPWRHNRMHVAADSLPRCDQSNETNLIILLRVVAWRWFLIYWSDQYRPVSWASASLSYGTFTVYVFVILYLALRAHEQGVDFGAGSELSLAVYGDVVVYVWRVHPYGPPPPSHPQTGEWGARAEPTGTALWCNRGDRHR